MFEKCIKKINNFNLKLNKINQKLENLKSENSPKTQTIKTNTVNINSNLMLKDIDNKTITYLKNFKKLNQYLELKEKGFNTNDALWAVYNQLKTESEIKNDIGILQSVLDKMGFFLYKENKNGLQYCITSYYLRCLMLDEEYYSGRLGVSKKRNIRSMIKKEKINLTLDYLKNSIYMLIPKYYNENKVISVFNFLKENLYKED